MRRSPSILVSVAILSIQISQTWAKIQCFVPGECLDSQILDSLVTNTSRTCLSHCQALQGCEWFTFYHDSQTCLALSGCLDLTGKKCGSNCISGENECPEIHCGLHGRCFGALEGIRKVGTSQECGTICQNREECQWHSYDPQFDSCTLTNDCPALDKTCSNCTVSERGCDVIEEEASLKLLGTTSMDSETSLVKTGLYMVFLRDGNFSSLDMATKSSPLCSTTQMPESIGRVQIISVIDGRAFICSIRDDKLLYTEYTQNQMISYSALTGVNLAWVPSFLTVILKNGTMVHFINHRDDTVVFDGHREYKGPPNPLRLKGKALAFSCAARVLDDQVYVAGGLNTDNRHTSQEAFKINFATQETTRLADVPVKLWSHSCGSYTTPQGPKVAVFGGIDFTNPESRVTNKRMYIFDWNTNQFEMTPPAWQDAHMFGTFTMKYENTFIIGLNGREEATSVYYFDYTNMTNPFKLIGKMATTSKFMSSAVATFLPGPEYLPCIKKDQPSGLNRLYI